MPEALIVQLSDVHVKTADDPIVAKWPALIRAIQAELTSDIQACIITFCGDAAFSGVSDQFDVAYMLLADLQRQLRLSHPTIPCHILTVPGNHDCDLTSHDQEARVTLRRSAQAKAPSPSISEVLLEPQKAYFVFAKSLSTLATLSPRAPFYTCADLIVSGFRLRFHLLNSSWTSILQETDDLRFPLDSFNPPSHPEAAFGITLIHHPVHWFLMPGVRRELRDLVDRHSELVLTGHEHEQETSRRMMLGGGEINYTAGGVLQDERASSTCTFNVIRLDLTAKTQLTKSMTWSTDHFEPISDQHRPLPLHNPNRADRRRRLRLGFENWLDELEDPIIHPRVSQVHLKDIFAFPDLRRVISPTDEHQEKDSHQVVERVRSEAVVDELLRHNQILITGGDRAGKTSLCKRLFCEFRERNCIPVFVRGKDLSRSGSEQGFRNTIEQAITAQYQTLTLAEFEQIADATRILLVDDLQDGPEDAEARCRLLTAAQTRFEKVILFAGDDYYLEMLHRRNSDAMLLTAYQRYELCDFGHQRLESLTMKWMVLGQPDADAAAVRTQALDVCDQVQSLLSMAGLPHTPWLLVVLLEQSDQTDTPFVAARNGNYGHLYHAVITVALAKSRLGQFDLGGKFIYLAELAYRLHKAGRATLREEEAREFHVAHCERFGLPFDYESVRNDLVDTKILRQDADELAFRSKWVYCFFVAWWLNRNMRHDEAKAVVADLTGRVYHETSANILVFLAHMSDDPVVIGSMRVAASALFREYKAADITTELDRLNSLDTGGSLFSLPPTPPDVNRKLLQDARDERAVRAARKSFDGRKLDPIPRDDAAERATVHRTLIDIQAAMRTIGILGQVLRNGATSIEEKDKIAILREVVGLGRRLLGYVYKQQEHLESIVAELRSRVFRLLIDEQRAAAQEAKGAGAQSLSLSDLRESWKSANRIARDFWFSINWMATLSVIKRLGGSVGMPVLDGTLARLRSEEDVLPVELVQLYVRLSRRARTIPADDMVSLHKRLGKENNKLARVVLEAMSWERLLLYETDYSHMQKICQQMGIKVPVKTLDASRKKFGVTRATSP